MEFTLIKSFACQSGGGHVIKSGSNLATIYNSHWGNEVRFPVELNPSNSRLVERAGSLPMLVPIDYSSADWSAWKKESEAQ